MSVLNLLPSDPLAFYKNAVKRVQLDPSKDGIDWYTPTTTTVPQKKSNPSILDWVRVKVGLV